MTNLRKVENYSIGLDLGVGSVGWAVIDENGELCTHGGKKTWGSRLFPEAQPAAERRSFRCARRRGARRRARIEELQSVFASEIYKVDSSFFNRLKFSKIKDVEEYLGQTLFSEYYDKQFPTIYHWRHYLMTTQDKADIRIVYLALHHIMKARGHFLNDDPNLSAQNADSTQAVEELRQALQKYAQAIEDEDADAGAVVLEIEDINLLKDALNGKCGRGSMAAEAVRTALGGAVNKALKNLNKALVGQKCDWSKFDEELEDVTEAKFSLSDENAKEKFEGVLTERLADLYRAACLCYSSYVLGELLEKEGGSSLGLSASMIKKYDRHKEDLKQLKAIYKAFFGAGAHSKYWYMFRGPKDAQGEYDIRAILDTKHPANKEHKYIEKLTGSYTSYILGENFLSGKSGEDAHLTMMRRIEADLLETIPENSPWHKLLPEHKEGENRESWHGTYLELLGAADLVLSENSGNICECACSDGATTSSSDTRGENNAGSICEASDNTIIITKEEGAALREKILSHSDQFLQKQRHKFNGSIPNQLQCEEARIIIENQGKHYVFLRNAKDHLLNVCSARIPYYVGPLNSSHSQNAWAVKREGAENVRGLRPWNYEQFIDRDASAEKFIKRMTGTCQYLHGEDVLPKCSLLYQEYCVRQELNGITLVEDEPHHITQAEATEIFDNLFMRPDKGGRVTHKDIKEYFKVRHNRHIVDVQGTQGKTCFASKLSTYADFCNILGVSHFEDQDALTFEDAEKIITWSTVFEDGDIYMRRLRQTFGGDDVESKNTNGSAGGGRHSSTKNDRAILSEKQIQKLAALRYKGWGRLSRKFLDGIYVEINARKWTLIDMLREGDPTSGTADKLQPTLLMKVINSQNLKFDSEIKKFNDAYLKENKENLSLTIDEMWASPTYKRAVRQAQKVVAEIVKVAGKDPASISIEVTREEREKVRSKTRKKQLQTMFEQLKKDIEFLPAAEAKKLKEELEEWKNKLDRQAVYLYFLQEGKCLYTGKSLDLSRLSEQCQTDHIIPQSYTEDDSLSNKALVLKDENQRKTDTLLLDDSIINKQRGWWQHLYNNGAMPKKKFDALTCREIKDRQMVRFIEKQLTETSQIAKFTEELLAQEYPNTKMRKVRAGMSSNIRERYNFIKVRWLNNFHHAHDALLAAMFSLFMETVHPDIENRPIMVAKLREHIQSQGEELKGKLSAGNSYFVRGFGNRLINTHTGEVYWDGEGCINYMRKVFSHRDVFVSQLVEPQTCVFSDETIISPKMYDKDKVAGVLKPVFSGSCVNRKEPLDPTLYGGTNKYKNAYSVFYCMEDENRNCKFCIDPIPVQYASMIAKGQMSTQEYLQSAAPKGCKVVRVLRDKICTSKTGSLVEYKGVKVQIGANTNGRNLINFAMNFVLKEEQLRVAKEADKYLAEREYDAKLLTSSNLDALFGNLVQRVMTHDPIHIITNNLTERLNAYLNSENIKTKCEILKKFIEYENAGSSDVNFSLIGGVKSEGKTTQNLNKIIEEITWIDQSITGMFEKRTTFKELTNGL